MKTTFPAIAVSLLTSVVMQAQGLSAPPPPPPPLTETQVLVAGQNVVIVSGTGSVAMAPDVVSIDLGVSTDGPTVRKTVDENNAKVAKIVAILKSKGVRPEQIKTSRFDLRPVERDGVRTGYEVSNTVGVSSKQVTDVGTLLDAAIDSGANEIRGPQFGVVNEKIVQDRCLTEAFGDAKAKATKLAQLSSRNLGRVLAATDGSSSPFELKHRSGVEGGVLGGLVIEPGLHTVECGVTVAFELQ
jgi:uncharacterized protein YggE